MSSPPNSTADSDSTDGNPGRIRRLTRLIAHLVFALPAILFLATFFGRWYWIFELISNFQWICFCCLVLSVLVFSLFRSWLWALGMSLVLAVSGWCTFSIYLPATGAQESVDTGLRLRVLSFNILHRNEEFVPFLELVERIDPDVIVIIEFTPRWEKHLVELAESYPHQVLAPRKIGSGMAIYSRPKLSDQRVYQLTPEKHDCPMIYARVGSDGHQASLFAVHTLSPRVPEYLEIRNRQLDELASIANDYEGGKIVVGDFNATTWSPFLKEFLMETGLNDSRRGRGLMSTWPAHSWLFRIPIDHMFVSDEVMVTDRWVEDPLGSDHLPIVGEFSIKD